MTTRKWILGGLAVVVLFVCVAVGFGFFVWPGFAWGHPIWDWPETESAELVTPPLVEKRVVTKTVEIEVPVVVTQTNTVTETVFVIVTDTTPTGVITPTGVMTTSALSASAIVITGSLKYDETGCPTENPYLCLEGTEQTEFPAIYVRNIQSGHRILVDGIVAIQELAAAAGVQTWDQWEELAVDSVNPTFVWCPGGCTWVPDTAFPLLGIEPADDDYTIGIIQAHAPEVPPAGQTTVICPEGDCWAVQLH